MSVKNLIDSSSLCVFLGFVLYAVFAISLSVYLIYVVAPQYGQSNILVYIAICSLIGSLSVMACKGLSIAIKLTFSNKSQLFNPLAWFFLLAVASCITVQMNYLNKALDIFNTSIVTPIYYVMFTALTIIASAILFQEWRTLSDPPKDLAGALCGFLTIIFGVFLLHAFKDLHIKLSDILSLTASRKNGGSSHGDVEEGGVELATREAPAATSSGGDFLAEGSLLSGSQAPGTTERKVTQVSSDEEKEEVNETKSFLN